MSSENMSVEEIPLTFACGDATLVGIVHAPERPRAQGLLLVIAGGPQYRIGCCRQQVTLARRLAARGIPVMRFDHRGMGDSNGEESGLDRTADIDAAIARFRDTVPGLDKVVLYGGCDGASAVAISSWGNPHVSGWILNNPFTEEESTQAQVMLKHYYRERLLSPDLWRKMIRLEFDAGKSLRALLGTLKQAKGKSPDNHDALPAKNPFDPSIPFTQRMLEGWKRFNGDVLLVIGGRSLVAKQFDQCVANSEAWQSVVHRPSVERVELADADHTFSQPGQQQALHDTIIEWFDQR